MIRLDIASEPRWLDLGHGVRVKAAPLTSAILIAARDDPAVRELPEEASVGERSLVFCKAVARRVILEWEGVGDADGAAIAPTAEGIDALLDLYPLFQAWEVGYVGKGLALSAEKNASAPSPNGTSAGATATARPARRRCPDCPAILNAPQTLEGIGVWDVALRMGGQLRAVPGAVLGWDLGVAMALVQALGVNPLVAAEILPAIEAIAVRAMNERLRSGVSHG